MINNRILTSFLSISLLTSTTYVTAFADVQNNGIIINNGVLVSVSGVTGELNIPEGVTSIAKNAFQNNQYGITKIKVPRTIKEIEPMTFQHLEDLKEIEFADGVESIGFDNFRLCSKLEKVKLPSTLRFLGGGAFSDCISLKSIDIPESLKELQGYTFSGCTNLVNIKIPSELNKLGADVFDGTPWLENLRNSEGYAIYNNILLSVPEDLSGDVAVPSGIKIIGGGAYSDRKNIKSIQIPEGVEEIGEKAFMACFNLEKVNLPKSLRKIDNEAFSCGMNLKVVNLPEGLESIGDNAFDSLIEVKLPDSIKSISGTAFGSDTEVKGNTLLYKQAVKEYKESLENICIADKHRCVSGWNHLFNGTFYLKSDGTFQTGWMNWNDKKLYFRKNCSMVTGFYTIDNKTYYFDEAQGDNYGCMVLGWKEINGKWYYFYGSDGTMAVNTNIEGYYLNEQGQLV